MRIHLPFQPQWRSAVLAGTKTTTVRTKRYGSEGDEFELEGATFVLARVEAMPLRAARDRFWREEGMGSSAEFERVWIENHPTRGFRPDDQVWVHEFEKLSQASR